MPSFGVILRAQEVSGKNPNFTNNKKISGSTGLLHQSVLHEVSFVIVGQDSGDVPVPRRQGLQYVCARVGLEENKNTEHTAPNPSSQGETCSRSPWRWTWRCGRTFLCHPEESLWWKRTCVRPGRRVAVRSAEGRDKHLHVAQNVPAGAFWLPHNNRDAVFSSRTCLCNQLSLSSSCFWKKTNERERMSSRIKENDMKINFSSVYSAVDHN